MDSDSAAAATVAAETDWAEEWHRCQSLMGEVSFCHDAVGDGPSVRWLEYLSDCGRKSALMLLELGKTSILSWWKGCCLNEVCFDQSSDRRSVFAVFHCSAF